MHTIHQSIAELHAALREYIEATYHISAASLIAQRRALLDHPGGIHQVPYLESTPRYQTGERFADMAGLSSAALRAFQAVAQSDGSLRRLLYDPPYRHQAEAIRGNLIDDRNLIIMTGTGSGKTESFLLPILGRLARQANESPDAFSRSAAVRALVLYPMNALVNDQLGRLRTLFGDPRIVALFKGWAGRPPRFARYTSRTPYAGLRTAQKDGVRLRAFGKYYVEKERLARGDASPHQEAASRLVRALRDCGKWPAKPDLTAWFGNAGSRWQNAKTGAFTRAVTRPDDTELLTRHEVQAAPPDVLVTNYSMLEYMLMRPIERPIFDMTRAFLSRHGDETFLVVLDEAHLYRGAAGAEVGLLLRRLRDRLGIPPSRLRVICATASFSDHAAAPVFGGEISGLPGETFLPISGTLALRSLDAAGSEEDADALAALDLSGYYEASSDTQQLASIKAFLHYRGVHGTENPRAALYRALVDYPPMGRLINSTMVRAVPLGELSAMLFPSTAGNKAEAATNALMALASVARQAPRTPSLLPCRVHSFFRGLPGLWVCMDPDCTTLRGRERGGVCGRMYGQPRDSCGCGARVLELYTCRNCGTAYARAYTGDLDVPCALWPEAGESLRTAEGETAPLHALDLLLEQPVLEDLAEPADYDLETGRLNPHVLGPRTRTVYVRGDRVSVASETGDESASSRESRGQFAPCAVCGKKAQFGRSYVQDHQTKGDQPFQALVARQLQVQPPSGVEATAFAPLRGRKVLTFADSRQVAARLAPNLQTYSTRDALRPLIVWGYRRLQEVADLRRRLSLEDLYLAALLASARFSVRLRSEVKPGESMAAEQMVRERMAKGALEDDDDVLDLYDDLRNAAPPQSVLADVVETLQDRFYGLEPLALASIVERARHTNVLQGLQDIQGVAETPTGKVALARAWLRCWQPYGFWLSSMPPAWWRRPRAEGTRVDGSKGRFRAMGVVLSEPVARRVFEKSWLPTLLSLFTEDMGGATSRLRGDQLTLSFDGTWALCERCRSVHRPLGDTGLCLDCGGTQTRLVDPDKDKAFLARKGFYRNPVTAIRREPPRPPMALVAAEHTAQLNAPQHDVVFSKAEENELLFQDIQLDPTSGRDTAIDVLSSTTTMEVGIDIGALSGIALRNMPPSRANYQQRSGRAGRRGDAIATVVAFGSADSHDEHYFAKPDSMIRGRVVDPKLALDNRDIAKRHIRAYVLQRYHQERIPAVDPNQPADLFSVLGTVSGFRSGASVLNRNDFAAWLDENGDGLRNSVAAWIPSALGAVDRGELLAGLERDCLDAVDDAIGEWRQASGDAEADPEPEPEPEPELPPEEGDHRSGYGAGTEKLLDRLLYRGKLPRYAFPTDVVAFHVFDRERATRYRPIMRFAPQQALPTALTQYAPGKQVWIAGKCYTSGAVYSVYRDDLVGAWQRKRIYMECRACAFASTYAMEEAVRGETRACPACGGEGTFGPARYWLRPPGFAHPVDAEEVTAVDDVPETSYATRAKLTMNTPMNEEEWRAVGEFARVLPSRQHLLVSNTGPRREGYTYCVRCGRIEASAKQATRLTGPHQKPYPEDEGRQICEGLGPSRHVVLGTDFITDIALFSMRVKSPLSLKPRFTASKVALRTVSEALARAGCELLELEPGELMAEYRPALTPAGKAGEEAEVFLYDTLPGGAGFSREIAKSGAHVLRAAVKLLSECSEQCDSSCYRCLRSFKNKLEHGLLDRHVGMQLAEYVASGVLPEFSEERLRAATVLLHSDLQRQAPAGWRFVMDAAVDVDDGRKTVPILAEGNGGRRAVVALSGPLTPGHPEDKAVAGLGADGDVALVVENELRVRRNLPAATRRVIGRLNGGTA